VKDLFAGTSRRISHFELVLKGHVLKDATRIFLAGIAKRSRPGLDVLERSLLSFQRPVPFRRRKKASDSRQRPPSAPDRIGYESGLGGSCSTGCRDFSTPPGWTTAGV
jgi:hypothetical protein